jgi:predicted nucleic acid-binding protein
VIVLDASVALAWSFGDEHSAEANAVADYLLTARAVVPPIWPLEVANALLSAERRGRLDAQERSQMIELLTALPIDVEHASLALSLGTISDVAQAHGLSAYDASYVELAHRLAIPLATLDARMAAAALALGVASFVG